MTQPNAGSSPSQQPENQQEWASPQYQAPQQYGEYPNDTQFMSGPQPLQYQPQPRAPYHHRKPVSGLAVTGLVLGIIALLISWIPIINNLAFILGIIGLIFAIIGIVKTKRDSQRRGRGMAIAGTVLSVISLLIVIGTQSLYGQILDDATDQTASASGEAPEAAPQHVEKDNLQACQKLMGDDMQLIIDIPGLLTGIGAEATSEQTQQLLDIHSKIEQAREIAESDLDGQLASLDVPFKQAADLIEAGGGSLTMDTSHVASDVTQILQTCAAAGYQVTDQSAADSLVEEQQPQQEEIPIEFQNALTKAGQYSDMMHMSKQGIYDQLTSEYGEQFSPEAAQYAVDNLQADYKANALEKAKSYQETMAMSPAAIYDQLISEYGEKFTPEEAQYAIDNLNK